MESVQYLNLTIEELYNIQELEELLKKERYISKAEEQSINVLVNIKKKAEEFSVKSPNGREIKMVKFFVSYPGNKIKQETIFNVDMRSAYLWKEQLKYGHKLFRVTKIGSGSGNLYVPTPLV